MNELHPPYSLPEILAKLDENANVVVPEVSESELTTARELKSKLDTLASRLREPPAVVQHEHESECAQSVQSALEIRSVNPSKPLEDVGQYQLLNQLGEGGMGQVYRAKHSKLQKIVALKVLPSKKLEDPQAVERFEREMRAVGGLDHPNIVRATDAGEVDGTHYLVMELVDGMDLSSLLYEVRRVKIADACELIRQAAVGIRHAHRRGMVHRDVKPSNLMLAHSEETLPTIKILDLGLALLDDAASSAKEELTTAGQMMGTLDYMAPEQVSDSHEVDIRADIYSLGATLFKLLTGVAPFRKADYSSALSMMMAKATEQAPSIGSRRDDLPDGLVEIIDKMLCKNPGDRFATPDEVIDAITPYTQGHDLAALLRKATGRSRENNLWSTAVTEVVSGSGTDVSSSGNAPSPPDPAVEPTITSGPISGVDLSVDAPWYRRRFLPAVLILTFAGLIAAGVLFRIQTDYGWLVVEIDDDRIEATMKSEGLIVVDRDTGRQYTIHATDDPERPKGRLKSGDYEVASDHVRLIIIDDGGAETESTEFKIRRGGKVRARVSLVRSEPKPAPETTGDPGAEPPAAIRRGAPAVALAPLDPEDAAAVQQHWADFLGVPVQRSVTVSDSQSITFALIPPGEYLMGTSSAQQAGALAFAHDYQDTIGVERIQSEVRHRVRVTQPFWLSIHEVTKGQFASFVADTDYQTQGQTSQRGGQASKGGQWVWDPAHVWNGDVGFTQTDEHPAVCISWNDAVSFCKWLSRRTGTSQVQLPSEAQWEYACRAGSGDLRFFGDDPELLEQYGWVGTNSEGGTQPVGLAKANPWGLHDLYGNVREWCSDWYSYNSYDATLRVDPSGVVEGEDRVVRGGSWDSLPADCRSASRGTGHPDHVISAFGFRVSMSLSEESRLKVEAARKDASAPTPMIAPQSPQNAGNFQLAWADSLALPREYRVQLGREDLTMVLIPPGEFMMGAPVDDPLAEDHEQPQHKVTLTRPFLMSSTEITVGHFRHFVEATQYVTAVEADGKGAWALKDRESDAVWYSDFRRPESELERYPVTCVAYADAAAFCEWLSKQEHRRFRLPTEAEWEYACRAGSQTAYAWGDDFDEVMARADSGDLFYVATCPPNAFGLFDMHGNVHEMCFDAGRIYEDSAVEDPVGPDDDTVVVRGGAVSSSLKRLRSSNRYLDDSRTGPGDSFATTVKGFRIVCELEQ